MTRTPGSAADLTVTTTATALPMLTIRTVRATSRWARLYGPYGDLDGDGVMNMDDRDRDGDGIRNRHDRFPHDPYRN